MIGNAMMLGFSVTGHQITVGFAVIGLLTVFFGAVVGVSYLYDQVCNTYIDRNGNRRYKGR